MKISRKPFIQKNLITDLPLFYYVNLKCQKHIVCFPLNMDQLIKHSLRLVKRKWSPFQMVLHTFWNINCLKRKTVMYLLTLADKGLHQRSEERRVGKVGRRM